MAKFEEEDLIFDFDDSMWSVIKYDEHSDYRNKIAGFSNSKAIDFLCRHRNGLFLIEAKDFRGYQTNNRQRVSNGDLAMEVAKKVRDSLVGLVGARQMSSNGEEWKLYIEALNRDRSIFVVLWLEEDFLDPSGFMSLGDVIARHLRWLTRRKQIIVMNRATNRLPGLSVSGRPGGIRP